MEVKLHTHTHTHTHTLLRLILHKDEHILGFGLCKTEERTLSTNCKLDWVHPRPGAEVMVTSDIQDTSTIIIVIILIIINNNKYFVHI